YDAGGMLAEIEDPIGRRERFRYAPGGLLVERIDAGGGVHPMSYDPTGLLERDGTAENATFTLTTLGVGKTEVKTGLGRTEVHERTGGRGWGEAQVFTHEDGTQTHWTNRTDGTTLVTWADGTALEAAREADPRLGLLAPYVRT